MRKGTFVISILVFGVLLLNGRAIAAERPVVYGKHQWEWVAPTGVNELREWAGIYAAKHGSTVQLTDDPRDGNRTFLAMVRQSCSSATEICMRCVPMARSNTN